jgi:uncharacterized protein (DUF885 family)
MTPDDLAQRLLDASLASHPLDASLLGLPGYDDALPDFSRAAEEHEAAALWAVVEATGSIPAEGLGEVDRQTLDLVRHTAPARAAAAELPFVEFTVSDFHGAPVTEVLVMLPKVPLDSAERGDGYVARLAGLPSLLDTAAGRHEIGAAAGRRPVRRLVEASVAQLEAYLADPDVGGLRRQRPEDPAFAERVASALDGAVRPALAAYRDRLVALAPDGRDDDHCGLCHLPDGDAYYATLARLHTSTALAPEELHRTGLEVAARVADEFCALGDRLWGTASLDDVLARLRADPDLRYGDGEAIVADARALVARAEEAAPRWFGELPDEACLVAAIPEVEAAGSPPAYYLPGAVDGSRQGTYFVNASRPGERARYAAETIAFHEAVPGHHFQLTIAQRQPGLSTARRVLWDTACAEGWGLYAERLADEMGLYSGDLTRLGMLEADIWRAGRLVVDTGIHHRGWSRRQAVDWFSANTPLAELVIESEVNRYITYPGQALAYMVGRIELERLRREATEALGAAFDLRAFHDVVLRAGPLPLPAMAGVISRWVDPARR